MEMEPAFAAATAGRRPDELYTMAQAMLALPDTSMAGYLDADAFVIDGQTVDATWLQGATVPLNVTGLPGLAMRFGTSRGGLPINVQVVGAFAVERIHEKSV